MLITKRHQLRCIAKHNQAQELQQASAAAKAGRHRPAIKDQVGTVAESLARDLAVLSGIESVEKKIALKRELLPKYLTIAQQYIESGANYQNELLFWCALWSLDTDDLETAFTFFDYAIAQQQATPDRFKRDLPTLATELIAQWAERQFKEGKSASPYIDQVCERLDTKQWPCSNDIVPGKAYKVAGQLCDAAGELKEALAFYQKAMAANDKAGCKTRVDKLKKQLNVE